MVSLLYCHLYDHEPKKLTSSIKVRLILELDKKMGKLSQEVESIREGIEQLERQTKERIDRIAKLLTEPIPDESELKI